MKTKFMAVALTAAAILLTKRKKKSMCSPMREIVMNGEVSKRDDNDK